MKPQAPPSAQPMQRDVSNSNNMGGLTPRMTKKARTEHHGASIHSSNNNNNEFERFIACRHSFLSPDTHHCRLLLLLFSLLFHQNKTAFPFRNFTIPITST